MCRRKICTVHKIIAMKMKIKELFRKFIRGVGLSVKQIIDSLLFLFLLTHTGLSFNEKVLE